MSGNGADLQAELDTAIDNVLDLLERGASAGVELDPLATIIGRLQSRGETINLEQAPPLMRMLLGGMMPT